MKNLFKKLFATRMNLGTTLINEVIGKFEKMITDIEKGVDHLNEHRTENIKTIEKKMAENDTINSAIQKAERTKAKLQSLIKDESN